MIIFLAAVVLSLILALALSFYHTLFVLTLLILLVALLTVICRQRLLDPLLPLLPDLLRILNRVLHTHNVIDLLTHHPLRVLDELRERGVLDDGLFQCRICDILRCEGTIVARNVPSPCLCPANIGLINPDTHQAPERMSQTLLSWTASHQLLHDEAAQRAVKSAVVYHPSTAHATPEHGSYISPEDAFAFPASSTSPPLPLSSPASAVSPMPFNFSAEAGPSSSSSKHSSPITRMSSSDADIMNHLYEGLDNYLFGKPAEGWVVVPRPEPCYERVGVAGMWSRHALTICAVADLSLHVSIQLQFKLVHGFFPSMRLSHAHF
ncbi:hypothetical protein NUW54_g14208 [Trametes sanguinea]|uniref:Uncharacterized protein n=1 Tax=Trametes sanguinea TaxID=158606 RepID=A0ACC1MDS0_9APHY|nr:hypothetical protein NUW54_g14208 [Trametes sanguinea]